MPGAATISSSANPLVKDVRRAVERGGRTAQGWCVAETFHLLEEALGDGDVRQVLAAESARAEVETRLHGYAAVPLAVLPDSLFRTISATETSQGVAALVKLREWSLDELFRGTALVVVLDGLQDPGNAGAIVRAAEAFGANGVVFLKGAVSPFNPKTLRASAGSLFRVPFVHGVDASRVCAAFRQRGVALFAAAPGTGRREEPERDWSGRVHNPPQVNNLPHILAGRAGPAGLIIGSEARGVSPELLAASTPITIPTAGVESLNAAVAAGILLYEAARQRSGGQ